jgi:hypothetical protein
VFISFAVPFGDWLISLFWIPIHDFFYNFNRSLSILFCHCFYTFSISFRGFSNWILNGDGAPLQSHLWLISSSMTVQISYIPYYEFQSHLNNYHVMGLQPICAYQF